MVAIAPTVRATTQWVATQIQRPLDTRIGQVAIQRIREFAEFLKHNPLLAGVVAYAFVAVVLLTVSVLRNRASRVPAPRPAPSPGPAPAPAPGGRKPRTGGSRGTGGTRGAGGVPKPDGGMGVGPLPKVPDEGISMGLPNFGATHANACWFNATLKMLASSTLLDVRLVQPIQGDSKRAKAREALRKELHQVFTILRTAKGEVLGEKTHRSLYDRFFAMIHEANTPDLYPKGAQHSPDEYLNFFLQCFSPFGPTDKDTDESSGQARFYRKDSIPGLIDEVSTRTEGRFTIDVPNDFRGDWADLTQGLEMIDDYKYGDGTFTLMRQLVYTALPDDLILNFQNIFGTATTSNVKIHPDTIIELPIYDPSDLEHPKEIRRYQVEAVVYHEGMGSGGGHYVAATRSADGKWRDHDDKLVSSNVERAADHDLNHPNPPTEWAADGMKRARLMRLKRIVSPTG